MHPETPPSKLTFSPILPSSTAPGRLNLCLSTQFNFDGNSFDHGSKRRRNEFSVNNNLEGNDSSGLDHGKGVLIEGDGGDDGLIVKNESFKSSKRLFSREEKEKGVDFDLGFDLNDDIEVNFEGKSSAVCCDLNEVDDHDFSLNVEYEELMSLKGFSGVVTEGQGQGEDEGVGEGEGELNVDEFDGGDEMNVDVIEHVASKDLLNRVKERYKDFAKQNAFRYAHFNDSEEERNVVKEVIEREQLVEKVDDLVGPFSIALKLVRDREKGMNDKVQNSSGGFPLVNWTPRKECVIECLKRVAPSLISLCVDVLVENVDAISSLSCVPDAIRNAISRKLCDSRKMNPHFLSLLLEGCPSEIRLADCSWLEECVFEKSFEACESKMLTVLQLDLGGHCLSDSSLRKALIPKGLEALKTISLKGACRVSDVGLAALVSSAPQLRSINLSQCSLLTDVGIESIANSLESFLQELYLDECVTLDAMRILPILKRLKSLEVLSLRGITSVSDKFIRELIYRNGQNMKELVLANCVNLTDSSLKIIAEKCSQLCVLDLSFLGKLTDIGMAYLGNVSHGIQNLKLDRCPLSDDTIAAFLETSGDSLKELSLNNIKKVGQNTTISLARRCKSIESLDLSWCRSLTDEALGLIADGCSSLRLLKIFGCTQVTSVFVDGHSNPHLQIVGLKLTPILKYIKRPEFQQEPLQ